MDKLKAMTVLVNIVDAGSLTGAAERLDMSLTAVVRTLAGLEETLGVRLLNRTTRRLSVTDEGRDYVERCRRLLGDLNDMESALTDRRMRPSGRLAITAPVMFGRLHVAPLVTDFLVNHPEMRIELLLLDRVIDLLEEGIDLAIRIGPLPDSSLIGIPLGTTQRVVCASPAFLERHGRPQQPEALTAAPAVRFAGLPDGNDWIFERAGERRRVQVRETFAANQVDVALEACSKGLGYGRFLAYQVSAAVAAGELVRVLDDWAPPPVPVTLVHAQNRLLSPRIRAFTDWAVPRLRGRLSA